MDFKNSFAYLTSMKKLISYPNAEAAAEGRRRRRAAEGREALRCFKNVACKTIVPTYGVWICKTTVPQPRIDTSATKGEQLNKQYFLR